MELHNEEIQRIDIRDREFLFLGDFAKDEELLTNLSGLLTALFMICLGDFLSRINPTITSYSNAMLKVHYLKFDRF